MKRLLLLWGVGLCGTAFVVGGILSHRAPSCTAVKRTAAIPAPAPLSGPVVEPPPPLDPHAGRPLEERSDKLRSQNSRLRAELDVAHQELTYARQEMERMSRDIAEIEAKFIELVRENQHLRASRE